MLAPLPDLKQFQRLGLLKLPWNTSPLMSYYVTSSNFRQPAWCPVDLCQTLKKEDLENSNLDNTDLENTDLENSNLENTDLKNTDLQNFHSPFLFFFNTFLFFAIFFVATSPSRLFLSWLCRDSFVATFTVGSKHNTCGKMASSATDDALKEVKWP